MKPILRPTPSVLVRLNGMMVSQPDGDTGPQQACVLGEPILIGPKNDLPFRPIAAEHLASPKAGRVLQTRSQS